MSRRIRQDKWNTHAGLRIQFEADAELLADACEQNADHGIDPALMRQVIARFRKTRNALERYERAAGIDLGRDARVRSLAELIAQAQVDEAVL